MSHLYHRSRNIFVCFLYDRNTLLFENNHIDFFQATFQIYNQNLNLLSPNNLVYKRIKVGFVSHTIRICTSVKFLFNLLLDFFVYAICKIFTFSSSTSRLNKHNRRFMDAEFCGSFVPYLSIENIKKKFTQEESTSTMYNLKSTCSYFAVGR